MIKCMLLRRAFSSSCGQPLRGIEQPQVTLDNIFQPANKQRVQKKLEKYSLSSRNITRPNIGDKRAKEAAVLVPLCHINGEPSILFMMRSKHLNSHSGEVCFPGGMKDEGDVDLIYTALRETHEEIALPSDQVDVWGTMQSLPSSMKGRWATPIVGYCKDLDVSKLELNHSEVELVFVRTIASLCDPANIRQTQMRFKDTAGYVMPVFIGGQYRIWGLTGIILHQLLLAIAPGLYNFNLKLRT